MGTGKAWAWHSRAKLEFMARTNILTLESLENVGAFAPTGSMWKFMEGDNNNIIVF